MPERVGLKAIRLLGKWSQLARDHVLLAGGCSCGASVADIRAQDFEEQILEYLQGRHGHRPQLATLLGDQAGGSTTLEALLRVLAKSGEGLDGADAVLSDLERTLESFERQHKTLFRS